MSEFWFYFFASLPLFSYSYRRVSLSTFRLSSSLHPQSTSCQPSSVPLCTESQDSECTVAEVAVRGTESAAAELPAPKVTVAMAVGSSEGLAVLAPKVTVAMAAGSSEVLAVASQEIALVVPSSPQPSSPSPLLASGGPPFG